MLLYAFICFHMLSYALYMLLFLYILGLKLENERQGRLRLGTAILSAVWAGTSSVTVPPKTRVTELEKTPTGRFEGSAVSGLACCECTGITDSF